MRPPLPGSRRWAGRRGAVKAKAVSLLTSCAPGLKAPPHASALAGEGAPRAAAMVGRPCRGRDHPLVSVRSLRLLGVALTPRYCALTREGSYAQQSVSTLKTHSSCRPCLFPVGKLRQRAGSLAQHRPSLSFLSHTLSGVEAAADAGAGSQLSLTCGARQAPLPDGWPAGLAEDGTVSGQASRPQPRTLPAPPYRLEIMTCSPGCHVTAAESDHFASNILDLGAWESGLVGSGLVSVPPNGVCPRVRVPLSRGLQEDYRSLSKVLSSQSCTSAGGDLEFL